MKSPIFIFSLPRSGSTLLQRILSGHSDIATSAEPWVILPLVYATKQVGVLSEYNQNTSSRAILEFINVIGIDTYNNKLNNFLSSLYDEYCSTGERYFLDKTPRYYLIIEEIKSIFPNAKCIFLFRNPLQVIGSVIDTFSFGGLERLYPYDIDLSVGFNRLSKGYEKYKGSSYALRYEDFIINPEIYMKEICDYLELEYQELMLSGLPNREVKGTMGDPINSNLVKEVDTSSMNKWRKSCSGAYRKFVTKKYISRIADVDFLVQGYTKSETLEDVESLNGHFRTLVNDFLYYNLGRLIVLFKLNIFFGRASRQWIKKRYLG